MGALFQHWTELPDGVRYIVAQHEICPDTLRRHWQGYAELLKPIRWAAFQKLIGATSVRCFARAGTQEQAANYCKKDETKAPGGARIELGTLGGQQGVRSDLAQAAAVIVAGGSIQDVINEHPVTFIRYGRGLRDLQFTLQRRGAREWRDVAVSVVYGQSGVGKTREAIAAAGDEYFILNSPDRPTLWWDGYQGERTLIIDDFYGWIGYHVLLRLLDGYEFRLPCLQGYCYAKWTTVIITSNNAPAQWYDWASIRQSIPATGSYGVPTALSRRIRTVSQRIGNLPHVEMGTSASQT